RRGAVAPAGVWAGRPRRNSSRRARIVSKSSAARGRDIGPPRLPHYHARQALANRLNSRPPRCSGPQPGAIGLGAGAGQPGIIPNCRDTGRYAITLPAIPLPEWHFSARTGPDETG